MNQNKIQQFEEEVMREIENTFNESAVWKIGTMNNYKGGLSDCCHDLQFENIQLRKAISKFIRQSLQKQRQMITEEVYVNSTILARDIGQTIGKKNDYYITLCQLGEILKH